MNKLKFLLRFSLAFAIFGIAFSNTANAQCNITGKADACVGAGVQFSVSGPSVTGAVDSIVWTFSNGSTRTFVPSTVTNVWSAPTGGPTVVTVKVYKGGALTPDCTATYNITVHANPVADFKLLSPTPQCFNGNSFNFEDNSQTPGGNPIVWREFAFGDGGKKLDSTSIGIPKVIGPYAYTPPTPAGGPFNPQMTIRDSKGCISFIEKTALLSIKPDLGADFTTPNPKNCLFTTVTFTNTSLIAKADAKSFRWEFGDGEVDNGGVNWTAFKHTYLKNGCFTAMLIIESNDGCFDTAKKQAACNVAPKLDVSVANGDVQCANNQQFIFTHPTIQGATFLWNFDDPPTGPLNFDNKNWITTHDFSSTGPFDVAFTLNTQGCKFDTVYRVHVKGPLAGIETKPAPLIAPSQRYQCKIKDTVYFPNISSYYFNDDSAFNDFYYTVGGAIFQFINLNQAHIDFDTITLNTGSKQIFTTKTGRNVYVSPLGDTVGIGVDTLILQGTYLIKGTKLSDRDAFHNNGKHVTRVWDFADNIAPSCTTDSRPIYPKSAANGNLHWPTSPAPAWTYDANGKWYNCNFSIDSLPKHWYTPGEERCYQVRLILKDTSSVDPNIQTLTSTHNDPTCESTATVNLALQGPDASGLRMKKDPCYGSPNVYGIEFFFDKTGPACDRQMFWIHLDSTSDRLDNTPQVFDKWIPQTGTVVDRLFTPWPLATMNLPPNVGSIYWQYQPNGGYPSKIADPSGWVTVGLRIQNGIDPVTGQPCIDEKWYHNAYRYIQAEPAYKFYNVNKPDSLYTFERLCSPNDIYVKREKLAVSIGNGLVDSTYASDSVGVDSWSWSNTSANITGGYLESGALVDSFYRYMCDSTTNFCYSYVKRFEFKADGSVILLDSVVTRIWDKTTQQTVMVKDIDSIPDVIKQMRINSPGRYEVSHALITCQSEERLVDGAMKRVKTCCDNPYFQATHIAVLGFYSEMNLDDSIVCRNTPIQFYDSARYYLEDDIPFYPFILDEYDFWDPAKKQVYKDGSPRPRPRPAPLDYEKIRWDFGDGTGFNASVPDNPKRSYSDPGIYKVQLEYTDSIACKQIETRNVTITGVSANFTFNRKLTNCRPTVDFFDTTLMLDPCRLVKNIKCDDIKTWFWDFGDNKPNNQSISVLKDPSHIYTSFGDFDVTLVVTTNLGCSDSIKRTISLEGPRPRFEFAADSVGCRPFTVEFRNTSINPSSKAVWRWDFGDGQFLNDSAGRDVNHTYDTVGTFEVILYQEDQTPYGTGLCNAIFPDTIGQFGNYHKYLVRVLPSRKTNFTVSDSIICVNDSVTFISQSDTIYSTYKWITGVGDTLINTKANGGDTSGKRYTAPGTYYVQLRPSYVPPLGEPACPTSAVKTILVRDVEAKFECDTLKKPVIYFNNQSRNASKIWWDFGNGNGFESGNNMPDYPNAHYNYGEKRGYYTVLLAVESPEGCLDTAYCQFDYDFKVLIEPFNIFTPGDGNDLNDLFKVNVENEEMYNIDIYNRWGEKVFTADNKDNLWDGKHKATGADCPPGVYFVVINYRLRGEDDKVYHGTLTLMRK